MSDLKGRDATPNHWPAASPPRKAVVDRKRPGHRPGTVVQMANIDEPDSSVVPHRGAMLLLVTEDGRLLLHHRDENPGITHPDCWAGFGGALEGNETVEEALHREMREETGLDIESPILLTEVFDEEGSGDLVSVFYLVGGIAPEDIDLHEGAGIGVWSIDELGPLKLTPFVRRVIYSHLIPALERRG
jgi:8-oxo-dGTP diphosphatase